jgi:hypothetical protein
LSCYQLSKPRNTDQANVPPQRHPGGHATEGGGPEQCRLQPCRAWQLPPKRSAFTEIVTVIRSKFGLAKMAMVGDRSMITSARIAALNQLEDGRSRPDAYS